MRGLEKKIGMLPALLVAVLSFGGFVGAATVMSHNGFSLTSISLADDEEGGDSEGDGGGDSSSSGESSSKSEKKKSEGDKKNSESSRESAKNQQNNQDDEGDSEDGANDEGDTEDGADDEGDTEDGANDEGDSEDGANDEGDTEDGGDNNAMYQDRDKTLNKLYEKLAEIEKDILEKQAEGVDVTAALARVASVKAVIGSVKGAFDVNNIDEVKLLAKEARKQTYFAKEDLHDDKKVAEDVAKVSKRITQAKGKIALLGAVGGDGSKFTSSLSTYEADLATLKATISAGGYDSAVISTALDALERKVKSVKSGVEGTIYALGGTDSELDNDLEDESDDIAEHLNDVADIEDDNVGRVIRRLSDDHKDATKKMSETVKNVDKRNPVLQTLFGADSVDLASLESEIAASKARTTILEQAANTVEDQDIKTILLDQVAVLKGQTAKLETFVSGQRDRLSAFGWFFNLL